MKTRNKLSVIAILMMTMVVVSGCQKHPPIPNPPKPTNAPTVKTVAVTLVSADETGAIVKASGEITNTGGTAITYRGFYLSKKKSPTINDTVVVASGGNSFSKTINLPVNGTYYLVAFATNDKGTSTGTVKMVKTDWLIKDYDGNVYHTVKFGNQWWLKENLKVTHYTDGSPIPNVTDNTNWMNLTTGAYCNYDNDTSLVKTYGRLYNYYSVETGSLAIKGWHSANDEDWYNLWLFIGGDNAGGKLKEVGTKHWRAPNIGATDEFGFTALPGGERSSYDGLFYDLSNSAIWWSDYVYPDNTGYIRIVGVNYKEKTFFSINYFPKADGISVRLVKD